MLSKAQEKHIRSLKTKKGRALHGQCIVEGKKVVEAAGNAMIFTFTEEDTPIFNTLVTTETPQDIAGVARIPTWTIEDVFGAHTIIVTDGVQDPGNMGAMFRLALGFNASIIMVESADETNPKVIRSSVGAMFHVPAVSLQMKEAEDCINNSGLAVFRLEKTPTANTIQHINIPEPIILIVGSEAQGIRMTTHGLSVAINHSPKLESLNVGHALAIALHARLEKTSAT